jgi:hypothetical protein
MKKILWICLIFATLNSCQENEVNNETSIENITIQELISALENDDETYKNKTFKIKANFKFSHPLAVCLGECSSTKFKEEYEISREYLFKDFDICRYKTEVVFQDNEENKISIGNFPKYKISEEYYSTSNYELKHLIENMDVEVKVIYNETYNYCKETKHPSLYVELSNEKINEIFNSIENIILIE